MVNPKVETMKTFVFLILAGLFIAGCADERGFRAKQFPTTAEEAARQRRLRDQNKKDQERVNKPAAPGAQQPPMAPGNNPPPPAPGTNQDNNPAAPAPANPDPAKQSELDQRLDLSARTIFEVLDPNSQPTPENIQKYKSSFSADNNARALKVIQGLTIGQSKPQGQNIQFTLEAAIDDGSGYQKALSGGAILVYGSKQWVDLSKKGDLFFRNPLNNEMQEASNVTAYAVFCLDEKCKGQTPLVWLYLQIGLEDGTVVQAQFFQDLAEDGKSIVIHSTMSSDIVKPFDKAYKAPSLEQVKAALANKNANANPDPSTDGLSLPPAMGLPKAPVAAAAPAATTPAAPATTAPAGNDGSAAAPVKSYKSSMREWYKKMTRLLNRTSSQDDEEPAPSVAPQGSVDPNAPAATVDPSSEGLSLPPSMGAAPQAAASSPTKQQHADADFQKAMEADGYAH